MPWSRIKWLIFQLLLTKFTISFAWLICPRYTNQLAVSKYCSMQDTALVLLFISRLENLCFARSHISNITQKLELQIVSIKNITSWSWSSCMGTLMKLLSCYFNSSNFLKIMRCSFKPNLQASFCMGWYN